MSESTQSVAKIRKIIASFERFEPMQFRMLLEKVIAESGEAGEKFLGAMISNDTIQISARLEMIRVSGYLRSNHLLIPLKNIIDNEVNIHLKKEAVISVSKYNNKKALNILNQALKSITSPLLLQTINNEIGKIKQNNPILALMPRFLEGDKNAKNFKVTIQILKRILLPGDVSMFVPYLDCGVKSIEAGAFELVAARGDSRHYAQVKQYLEKIFDNSVCVELEECDELYSCSINFKHFCEKNMEFVKLNADTVQKIFLMVHDIRVREILVGIMCRSERKEDLLFIKKIYDENESLRKSVIIGLEGNKNSGAFLFELYGNESLYRENIINSLLQTKEGLEHFFSDFDQKDSEEQELIISLFPFSSNGYFREFSRKILQSEEYRHKLLLLSKVRENFEFSVADILFDPDKEREFYYMENDYLPTIMALFPLTAFKRIVNRVVLEDLSVTKTKKLLMLLRKDAGYEFAFDFNNTLISELFEKVSSSGNKELGLELINTIMNVRTIDGPTYVKINRAVSDYASKRGTRLTESEKKELRRFKGRFGEMGHEIKKLEDGKTLLVNIAVAFDPDLERLMPQLEQNGFAFALNTDEILMKLRTALKSAPIDKLTLWNRFFEKFPKLSSLFADELYEISSRCEGILKKDFSNHFEKGRKKIKIFMVFDNKAILAAVREQVYEIMPSVEIVVGNTNEMGKFDTLVCDSPILKDYMLRGEMLPANISLIIENRSEYSAFTDLKPRFYVMPVPFHKVARELIRDLYI